MLTALVQNAPSNPHKGVEFHTSWDVILGRDQKDAGKKAFQKILEGKTEPLVTENDNEKDRDGGMER